MCTFFDVVYLNWNPSMFSHTYSIVGSWNAGSGPIKDMYNVSHYDDFSFKNISRIAFNQTLL